VLATRLGYVSTLKWDAFFAKYDSGLQYYSAIGTPPQWTLKPVYYQTQLFTRAVAPGMTSVRVAGPTDARMLAGFAGPRGDATVIALNQGTTASAIDVTGLPQGTKLQLLVLHGEGDGTLSTSTLTTRDACQAKFTVPARSVAAITTL